MHRLMVIAIALGALLALIAIPTAAAAAQSGATTGITQRGWVWGPPTCVRIWNVYSRQTRYGGAPPCRRMPM